MDPPSSIPSLGDREHAYREHADEVLPATTSCDDVAQRLLTMPAVHVLRLNRILLPVDLAEPSEAAIGQAHWWALRFDALLDVLHVPEEGNSGDAQGATAASDDESLQAMVRDLSEVVERVVPDHVPQCHVLVRRGLAAPTIAHIAASTGADLIVMGSHGRHPGRALGARQRRYGGAPRRGHPGPDR